MTATHAQMYRELEADLRLQYPGLRNIHVEAAKPTGDHDTKVLPPLRWYEVTFTADGE